MVKNAKIQPGRGVRINNIYYWGDMLDHPELEGQSVFVRYDPFNMSIAYAYVNKYWIKLRSENFMIFENRTEKEIQIATIEIRKRMKNTGNAIEITGKIIANFLNSAESKEVLQIQHLKDKAARLSVKVTDWVDRSNNNTPKSKESHLSIVSEENIISSKKQEEMDTKKFVTYEEF